VAATDGGRPRRRVVIARQGGGSHTAFTAGVLMRVIELSRSSLPRAHTASKLNRDPLFIQNLISHGERQAAEFLAALAFERAWADNDVAAVMASFAADPAGGHPR
jgi:hypothetical protein